VESKLKASDRDLFFSSSSVLWILYEIFMHINGMREELGYFSTSSVENLVMEYL